MSEAIKSIIGRLYRGESNTEDVAKLEERVHALEAELDIWRLTGSERGWKSRAEAAEKELAVKMDDYNDLDSQLHVVLKENDSLKSQLAEADRVIALLSKGTLGWENGAYRMIDSHPPEARDIDKLVQVMEKEVKEAQEEVDKLKADTQCEKCGANLSPSGLCDDCGKEPSECDCVEESPAVKASGAPHCPMCAKPLPPSGGDPTWRRCQQCGKWWERDEWIYQKPPAKE